MTPRVEGFTLIEVLVSFAIMAGAIIMAFTIFGDGLRGLNSAQKRSSEMHAAQHQIDLALQLPALSEGTALVTDNAIRLRVVVEELPVSGAAQNFVQKPFKVSVFSETVNKGTPPILETIMIARPAQP